MPDARCWAPAFAVQSNCKADVQRSALHNHSAIHVGCSTPAKCAAAHLLSVRSLCHARAFTSHKSQDLRDSGVDPSGAVGCSDFAWHAVLALAVAETSFHSVLLLSVWALRTITFTADPPECKRMPGKGHVKVFPVAGQTLDAVQVVVISLMIGSLWFNLGVTPANARSFTAVCLPLAVLLGCEVKAGACFWMPAMQRTGHTGACTTVRHRWA